MNNRLKIHIVGWSLIFLVLIAGYFFTGSAQQRILAYVSNFGFLALLSLIFVLSLPLLTKFSQNDLVKVLSANRRWIGVYTFVFALIHVALVYVFFLEFDFWGVVRNLYFVVGAFAFLILAVMAVTSNNKSVSILGKNWKRIHYLVYVALIFVMIHSFSIGQIFLKSMIVKVLLLLLITTTILLKIREYVKTGKTM